MSSRLLPKAYTMCRSTECEERQSLMQVSEWESTKETQCNSQKERKIDPCLAVAKYRRSAAGEDYRKRPPRSLVELDITVNHLLTLFEYQALPPLDDNNTLVGSETQKSLLTTVTFLDDRIRACQVDFVVGRQSSPNSQSQLVRYHLIVLYLMSDIPRDIYEPKFAIKALWTALSAYWNGHNDDHDTNDQAPTHTNDNDNQISCLTILCRVASCLIRDETALTTTCGGWNDASAAGYSALLQEYAFRPQSKPSSKNGQSKWTDLALGVASAAHIGNYRSILSLLTPPASPPPRDDDTNEDGEYGNYLDNEDPFHVLCRCCMVPAINVIRIGALRQYNKCFGKNEKISGDEMARLLHLPSAETAIAFCQLVGLPIGSDNFDHPYVIMKAAPIAIVDDNDVIVHMQTASREEDPFVFGKSMYDGMMNSLSGNKSPSNHCVARMDQDGVLIPPQRFFSNLVRLSKQQ